MKKKKYELQVDLGAARSIPDHRFFFFFITLKHRFE